MRFMPMAQGVSVDQIEQEKKRVRARISKDMQVASLKRAELLEQHARIEPFPTGDALLKAHKDLVRQEKKLSKLLSPRTIKKPDHHLKEAEMVPLQSKKQGNKKNKRKSKKQKKR